MSSGQVNINISGGTSNVGNISQGDNNTNIVQSQSIKLEMDKAFSDFWGHLEKISASTQIHDHQIAELRSEIVSLKELLETKPTSKESLVQIAKSLYNKYGWAADMLKKLFSILVP